MIERKWFALNTSPRSAVVAGSRHRDGRQERRPADHTDKATVASLSPPEISQMTCAALVRVIRSAGLPFVRSDIDGRLEGYDRPTLERLAYLARRCCRNQGY